MYGSSSIGFSTRESQGRDFLIISWFERQLVQFIRKQKTPEVAQMCFSLYFQQLVFAETDSEAIVKNFVCVS